tara:strand:+ start:273 stop:803 length:531 start_codon:yes stop_codon:yes gene_type:complete
MEFLSARLLRIRKLAIKILFGMSTLFSLTAGLLAGATSGMALPYNTAILQGIDKVTARVSTIRAPINTVIQFGALEIVVRHCDKRLPEELPESSAFLEISEVRQSETAVNLFKGWMLASSPALSALEHPVYDILVLNCGGNLVDEARAFQTPIKQFEKDIKSPSLQKLLDKINNQN